MAQSLVKLMTGNNACGQLQTVKNQYLLVILGISISPYPRIFHYTFNEFWPQVSSLLNCSAIGGDDNKRVKLKLIFLGSRPL